MTTIRTDRRSSVFVHGARQAQICASEALGIWRCGHPAESAGC